MAGPGSAFPIFTKIEHVTDDTARARFMADVDQLVRQGEERFRTFSVNANQALANIGAKDTLDRALGLSRTTLGSLDVGTASLRQTAIQAETAAQAARELAVATELLQRENNDYSVSAARNVAAAKAQASAAEEAARQARAHVVAAEQLQAVLDREAAAHGRAAAASRAHGVANDNLIGVTRQSRAALTNLSYQLGDVAQGFALGVSPMTIFAQQGGQVVQALTAMGGGTSRLLGLLAGPWGIGISTAAVALSPLIAKLFETKEAAEQTASALQSAMQELFASLAQTSKLTDVLDTSAKQRIEALADVATVEREIASVQRVLSGSRGAAGVERDTSALEARLVELQRQKSAAEAQARDAEAAARTAIEASRVAAERDRRVSQPSRSSGSDTGGTSQRTSALRDEARTAMQAARATDAFIAALVDETARLGLNAAQLRQYEVEKAKAAAATDAERAAIEAANAAREEAYSTEQRRQALARNDAAVADLETSVLKPIRDEIALVGLVGSAREKAALALEEEAFKARQAAAGVIDLESAWHRYLDARTQGIDAQSALERDAAAAQALSETLGGLSNALGGHGIGGAVGGLLDFLNPQSSIGRLLTRSDEQIADELHLLTKKLGETFSISGDLGRLLAGALQGANTGAMASSAVGGSAGAGGLIGSVLQIAGMGGPQIAGISAALGISNTLGNIFSDVLGISYSKTAGSLFGVIGGLIGGLFKKKPTGSALLTGIGDFSVTGNTGGARDSANSLGGSVQEGLANIAEELGATLGAFRVSIGTYRDNIRVSTRGSFVMGGYSGSEAENEQLYGLYNFGQDQGAAIAFAIMDAIKDGAIRGISASAQRLLTSGGDIEQALRDVLDFQSVFKRLRERKDPIGSALDELDDQYEHYQDLFERAGATQAEWNQLEELYWLERDDIIKQGMEATLGSLRSFMDELTIGNDARSLSDRRAAALEAFDPLASRVAAGDSTAYDDFVEAARALLDIERQMFGSQQGYFDRLDQITDLTQGALDGGAGANFADRDSPFGERASAPVVSAIDAQTAALVSHLDAVNINLGRVTAAIEASQARDRSAFNYGRTGGGW